MKIILILTVVLLVTMPCVSIYILARNEKVCKFRIYLSDTGANILQDFLKSDSYDYERFLELRKIWRSIIEDTTYNEMLYSFKKLDIESWLTEEQQEFIKLKF